MESKAITQPISTGIAPLDQLLMGGLPRKTLMQIFGVKGTWKSTLSFQLALRFVLKEKRSVLYFDTEQSFVSSMLQYRYEPTCELLGGRVPTSEVQIEEEILGSRDRRIKRIELMEEFEEVLHDYGIKATDEQLKASVSPYVNEWTLKADEKIREPCLYYVVVPEVEKILALHGAVVEISASEGGRVETRMMPGSIDVTLSEVYKLCSAKDVGLIVYDSISAPLKQRFISTQDFPARSGVMNIWFGRAQTLSERLRCTILALNHASLAPFTSPFQKKDKASLVKFYGGSAVGYDYKFSLYLEVLDKKPPSECLNREVAEHYSPESLRLVWTERHPARAPMKDCVIIRMGDKGFE